MAIFLRRLRILAALAALVPAMTFMTTGARADDDEAGRQLYVKYCSKCHGLITEDAISWTPEGLYQQAVTLPLGPSLTGIYGREAGIMSNYPYSRAFRSAIENPWAWDEDTLDGWLYSTQDFIRGSTMFLKVEDDGERAMVIAYLKKYAQYRPE
jgi:cytochrome c